MQLTLPKLLRREPRQFDTFAEVAEHIWPSTWWIDGPPDGAFAVIWHGGRASVVRLFADVEAAIAAAREPRHTGGRIYRLALDGTKRAVRV